MVQLNDEAWEYFQDIKLRLTPPDKRGKRNKEASSSDVILTFRDVSSNVNDRLKDEFDIIQKILLIYYKGNASKAHLAKGLFSVCIKAMISERNQEIVAKGLNDIMEMKE